MARKSITTLTPGEDVCLKFHGSAVYGNEPYEMDVKFVSHDFTDPDNRRATFDMGEGSEFEAYFFENRWRYGSSAEVLTVAV